MSDTTLQFIYRVGAVTMAACIGGILGTMIAGVFFFGDGEGLRILDSLSGPFLSLLGTVVALLAPHQIAAAFARVRSTPTAAAPAIPAPAEAD